VAATDIFLCPPAHGATDIDLRTATACDAAATTTGGGRRPRRRRALRHRTEIGVSVAVTGVGAFRDVTHIGLLASGRGAVRFTAPVPVATTSVSVAIGVEADGVSHWEKEGRATVNVAAVTRYMPARPDVMQLVDPDELLLLDLL